MTIHVMDEQDILDEVVMSLRNADIFTIAVRGVTTQTDTGSVNGTTITIARSNVKNIRSLTIGILPYTNFSINLDAAGSCVLTLAVTQNDTYSIIYDYGTDKIFSGHPRQDLSINSFPQIGVEFLDTSSDNGGFGNVNMNRYDLSITTFAPKKEDVRNYTKAIRSWLISNMNSFRLLRVVKPTLTGPCVPAEFEKFKDRMFKQNIDFRSLFNLEIN